MAAEQSIGWLFRIWNFVGGTWLDQRKRKRLRADFNVTIEGAAGLLQAHGVDASRRGIGVLAPHAVPLGLPVFVCLSDVGLSGFAYIRYCTEQANGTFRVGLKFREPLHRKRPEPGKWTYRRITYGACGTWDDSAEVPALSPQ